MSVINQPLIIVGAIACMACLSGCWAFSEEPFLPTPSYQESLSKVGERCIRTPCQSGLVCVESVCQWASCSQAPDPAAYCEQSSSVEGAQCIESECKVPSNSTFNLPCDADASICGDRGVCVEERCRQACDVVGQSCVGGFECVEEDNKRFCSGVVPCNQQIDPDGWCAEALGLPEFQAICSFGRCVESKQVQGGPCDSPDDCEAGLTCYKGMCLRTCQERQACESWEVCAKPGNACVFDSSRACGSTTIPSVTCAIREGGALARAFCDPMDECIQLEPVEWPVLLIKDVSEDPDVCTRSTTQLDYPGTTPTSIMLTPTQGMESRHVWVDVLRKEFIQEGASSFEGTAYFQNQRDNPVEGLAGDLCADMDARIGHLLRYSLPSLGCLGKIYVRVNQTSEQSLSPQMVSLGGGTHALEIGWLRSSCEGFAPNTPEPKTDVYRCKEEVFEVGDEQACELLVEEMSMDAVVSRYLLP